MNNNDKDKKEGSHFTGSKASLLGSHGIVDLEKGIKSIQFRAGADNIDIDYVNKASEKGLLFLNDKGIPMEGTSEEDEKHAKYRLVPIGYTDKFTGNEMCASFMKGSFSWEGIFVGTVDTLIDRIMINYVDRIGNLTVEERNTPNRFKGNFKIKGFGITEVMENNKIIEQSNKNINNTVKNESIADKECSIENSVKNKPIEVKANVYEEIYDRLLIKENWRASTKKRLRTYIKSLTEKISHEQTRTESLNGNGYILSNKKDRCIFNTGLLDIYNNDIFLIDLDNNEKEFSKKEIITTGSKAALISYGFNKEDIMNMPKPIKFYEDKGHLIFNGSIDEFDLEDNHRLNHIIQERRLRFPEKYQDTACDVLCEKVKSAINKAVRLSERDYKYIVPMYNLKLHKIQYLMPLHLGASIEESPELVIVVGENNGFYCVYTILTTDDAYDNARLLSRPDSTWLRVQ